MPLRDYRILRYVSAFCPSCHREDPSRPLDQVARLSGYLAADEGGRVHLVRGCPTHGRVSTRYDESAEILGYLEQWTAPTKQHTPDTIGNFAAVPGVYLQGLGEAQTQHTCILLEDITEACNLRCPTCFADSAPDLKGVVAVEDVLANIDQRLARENGRLDVVMLSGGEPTIHPQFEELLERVLQRDIVRVLVNTNGIRLAQDDKLLALLRKHRERTEVYLQFDGFSERAHKVHRNADLRRIKASAVERLSEAGVFTTLTMTVSKGVNDDEIGAVIQYALDTPYVGGVALQPQFSSGRSGEIDPQDRLTHTGVLARLGPQTGGAMTWRDLTALPCSHPHCASVGYFLRTDSGDWRSMVSLIGVERLKEHLDLVSNRVVDKDIPRELRLAVRESLLGLLSDRTSLSHPQVGDLFRDICESCDLGMSSLLSMAAASLPGRRGALRRMIGERVVRVTVKPFMDIDTMLEERLLQCCVHVGTRTDVQDQCAPFCAVQAWPALSAQKLPVTRADLDLQVVRR
jgi:pyruvate-formate lyase-activating enzyme